MKSKEHLGIIKEELVIKRKIRELNILRKVPTEIDNEVEQLIFESIYADLKFRPMDLTCYCAKRILKHRGSLERLHNRIFQFLKSFYAGKDIKGINLLRLRNREYPEPPFNRTDGVNPIQNSTELYHTSVKTGHPLTPYDLLARLGRVCFYEVLKPEHGIVLLLRTGKKWAVEEVFGCTDKETCSRVAHEVEQLLQKER